MGFLYLAALMAGGYCLAGIAGLLIGLAISIVLMVWIVCDPRWS